MSNKPPPEKQIHLQLTFEEATTILEALGQMPYIKVYLLINKLQQQARPQLDEMADGDKLKNNEE